MKRKTTVGAAIATVAATGGLLTLASATSSAAPIPAGCTAAGTTVTCNYLYTGGQQTFVAPAGITTYNVTAVGAAGGFGPGPTQGGFGVAVTDTVALSPGQTYYVNVGGKGGDSTGAANTPGAAGGYNGGGRGSAALTNGFFDAPGGGGATSLQTVSGECNFAGAIVVAGGGGGGGVGVQGGNAGKNGGDGGNGTAVPTATGGKGATTTAGGAAGSDGPYTGNPQPGTACHGGDGGPATPGTGGNVGGAGGGGGLFGGGGGGATAGGGGGSSLGSASATYLSVSSPANLSISYVDPTLATPIADPVVGLAAFAGVGAAALVVVSRRRRTEVTSQA
jgi:hypothetical protein